MKINRSSFSEMRIGSFSILLSLAVFLFNDKVLAFPKTEKLDEIVFCDRSWRGIGG
jgi:hypothetical protein